MNLIRLAGCCLPLLITFPAAAGQPGEVSSSRDAILPADSALQIDCSLITGGFFGIQPTHGVEGFLTIESSRRLNVQATYTTSAQGTPSIAVQDIR